MTMLLSRPSLFPKAEAAKFYATHRRRTKSRLVKCTQAPTPPLLSNKTSTAPDIDGVLHWNIQSNICHSLNCSVLQAVHDARCLCTGGNDHQQVLPVRPVPSCFCFNHNGGDELTHSRIRFSKLWLLSQRHGHHSSDVSLWAVHFHRQT